MNRNVRSPLCSVFCTCLIGLVLALGTNALCGNPFTPVEEDASVHPFRKWKDDSGTNQVEARFVSANSESVKLTKHDGTVIDVPIQRLSRFDQGYVQGIREALTLAFREVEAVDESSPFRLIPDSAATAHAPSPYTRPVRSFTSRTATPTT